MDELQGKKIYNDLVDEEYELDQPEEVIEEQKIFNQHIDGEVKVSDSSNNYIPTPRDDNQIEENFQNNEYQQFEQSQSLKESQKVTDFKPKLSDDVDEDVKQLYKYVYSYQPKDSKINIMYVPFIPDYMPTVGEVDGFIKVN